MKTFQFITANNACTEITTPEAVEIVSQTALSANVRRHAQNMIEDSIRGESFILVNGDRLKRIANEN